MFNWLRNSRAGTIRNVFSVFLLLSILLMVLQSCSSLSGSDVSKSPIKVELTETGGKYLLLRGGKPYVVKGAGLVDKMEVLAEHGANSFRTWSLTSSGPDTGDMLDKAHELGLTVSLGVYVGSERHEFDYRDEEQVNEQLQRIKKAVIKHRNHPALLTWIVGNELNHGMTDVSVYDAVDEIAKMIKELDPNHPTTTTIAGFNADVANLIEQRAPNIDFLSIQLYGDLVNLPRFIQEAQYSKPYMVTEWGAVGHWEVEKTEWGAPIEYTSTMKAANYLKSYQTAIAPYSNQIVGSYVFLWGQKQERTPTWYGMFTEHGERTEAVDTMHYIWNGKWPKNRAPIVNAMKLDSRFAEDNVILEPGKRYSAQVDVRDLDDDDLDYRWKIMRESDATQTGGDLEEVPENIKGLLDNTNGDVVTMLAPREPGDYRLFVYATDVHNNAAHANIPFHVSR